MRELTALAASAVLALAALATSAAAQGTYLLRPGDVVRIEVIEDASLNRDVLVPPDGRITLPLAGTVQAGGRSVEQVAAGVASGLSDDFTTPPNVFVSLARLAPETPVIPSGPVVPAAPLTWDIFILGEANNPGRIEVPPGTTILQLFALAGGFTDFAATRRLQLRRIGSDGTEQIYPLNYDAILAGQSPNGSVTVKEGDVFVVPQRGLFE